MIKITINNRVRVYLSQNCTMSEFIFVRDSHTMFVYILYLQVSKKLENNLMVNNIYYLSLNILPSSAINQTSFQIYISIRHDMGNISWWFNSKSHFLK